jgi:D-alanine-D-alanine ligase
MKIGLTYDLRSEYIAMGYTDEQTAEFDRDDTIIAIEGALHALGHETDRIGNAKKLTERLVRGDRWDFVFNIAEGLKGVSREAQVPVILDLYEIPYTFSDPLVMSLTLHKGLTKQVIKERGLPTPDFIVIERPADVEAISMSPPYFIKPVAEGTGQGITAESVIWERQQLSKACRSLLDRYEQPVLVERYLPGREFTVGILGTGPAAEVLGTLEVILLEGAEKNVYSYTNKEKCEDVVEYRLVLPNGDRSVREAETVALESWRVLGCRDGGRVDLRCDEKGKPYFLEVNPMAGLHPEHSDLPILSKQLGMPYDRLIQRILDSAAPRVAALSKAGTEKCA